MTETKLEDAFESASESVQGLVDKRPSWLAAVIAGFVVGALAILTSIFSAQLMIGGGETEAPAAEDLEISDTAFSPSTIELDLTNNSDDSIGVGQMFINDQYVNFEGPEAPIASGGTEHFMLDFPWQEERTYLVAMVLSDGSVFETELETSTANEEGEAAEAEEPTPAEVWYLLGIAVIAAASIVVFAVPALRKSGADATRSVLGVSTGLLAATGVVAAIVALTHL
jgi:hypothetical protein